MRGGTCRVCRVCRVLRCCWISSVFELVEGGGRPPRKTQETLQILQRGLGEADVDVTSGVEIDAVSARRKLPVFRAGPASPGGRPQGPPRSPPRLPQHPSPPARQQLHQQRHLQDADPGRPGCPQVLTGQGAAVYIYMPDVHVHRHLHHRLQQQQPHQPHWTPRGGRQEPAPRARRAKRGAAQAVPAEVRREPARGLQRNSGCSTSPPASPCYGFSPISHVGTRIGSTDRQRSARGKSAMFPMLAGFRVGKKASGSSGTMSTASERRPFASPNSNL